MLLQMLLVPLELLLLLLLVLHLRVHRLLLLLLLKMRGTIEGLRGIACGWHAVCVAIQLGSEGLESVESSISDIVTLQQDASTTDQCKGWVPICNCCT